MNCDIQSAQTKNSREIDSASRATLSLVRHVALDMDGTIYSGATPFNFTGPFLELIEKLGIGHTFLTNNSSRSKAQYLAKLAGMSLPALPQSLYTSTESALEYLGLHLPQARRLYVLGTDGLKTECTLAGYKVTGNSHVDVPDAVLVGFDTELNFQSLCRAAYWIKAGKPFVATHPDRVCPTDEPTVLVDCGAVCAALTAATGRAPDMVLGKPHASMIRGILKHQGLEPAQLAMVGDRLYTDVEMARRAGAVSVLVLTGETSLAEANSHSPPPDFVVSDLGQFGRLLAEARRSGGNA